MEGRPAAVSVASPLNEGAPPPQSNPPAPRSNRGGERDREGGGKAGVYKAFPPPSLSYTYTCSGTVGRLHAPSLPAEGERERFTLSPSSLATRERKPAKGRGKGPRGLAAAALCTPPTPHTHTRARARVPVCRGVASWAIPLEGRMCAPPALECTKGARARACV